MASIMLPQNAKCKLLMKQEGCLLVSAAAQELNQSQEDKLKFRKVRAKPKKKLKECQWRNYFSTIRK